MRAPPQGPLLGGLLLLQKQKVGEFLGLRKKRLGGRSDDACVLDTWEK